MIARSQSSFLRTEALRAAGATAAGIAVFAVAWSLLHAVFWDDYQIVDTPVYQSYGERMLDGEVPYRDFGVEYPPAALPVFLLPSLSAGESYGRFFEALMLVFGAAGIALMALALAALGASTPRLYGAVLLAAVAPLLLGTVILTRYDLWPALLVAASLAALLVGRGRLGLGILGLAVAAKVYPLVLLPLALAYLGKRKGRHEALAGLVAFLAVLLVVFLPFLVVAPGGLLESLQNQAGRPLQIESLGAGFLLAGQQLGLYEASVVSTHGSQNLDGPGADAIATVQTIAQALAVIAVWAVFARGRADGERLVAASAAAVVAFVAFGKVLSPQYLVWLILLVPLVGGAGGVLAGGLFAAALVLTQLWFPTRYWDLVALEPAGWLVLLRDVVLVALFAVLVGVTSRARGSPRNAERARPHRIRRVRPRS